MRTSAVALSSLVLVFAMACGSAPSAPSGPSGTLSVRITDSPFGDARAVFVTFSEVAAHRSGTSDSDGEWLELAFAGDATTRTCDLKKLVDAQDVLGVGAMNAGHYTQVRITVTSATIFFDNPSTGAACATSLTPPVGRSSSVSVSSGEVKLNQPFDVSEGGATTILVDFDGDKSITQTGLGGYRMSPVIGVVSVQ